MAEDRFRRAPRILVIDDEESVTGVIEAVLVREGYEVHIAADGVSGIALASEIRPDMVFMDITMPEMDGYEAATKIRQDPLLSEVPIIFLTGKSPDEDSGEAFRHGGTSYIRKPFSGRQIRDLVKLTMMSVRG